MTPACEDWGPLSTHEVEPLLAAEARCWAEELGWDVTVAWRSIEPARLAGHLAGLIVRDSTRRVTGWTCFLLHRQTLQVAMIVAETPAGAGALIDGILRSPQAAKATTHSVCVRDAAPGLRDALAARGFEVETYRYLERALDVPGAIEPPCRRWEIEDASAMARLCARAYAGTTEVRAFAPHGTMEEWHEYIASLVTGPGCGEFIPDASFAIPGRHARRLDGAIITTNLGPGTAHVAQVAVDPDMRGQGLGRCLVESALAAAASRGFLAATLLVADANVKASSLYEQLEFREKANFVVAVKRQPRRLRRITPDREHVPFGA